MKLLALITVLLCSSVSFAQDDGDYSRFQTIVFQGKPAINAIHCGKLQGYILLTEVNENGIQEKERFLFENLKACQKAKILATFLDDPKKSVEITVNRETRRITNSYLKE